MLQVRNLRERLEEEHQALLQREQDKAALELRIARLTRIILSSTKISKADVVMNYRYRDAISKVHSVSSKSSSLHDHGQKTLSWKVYMRSENASYTAGGAGTPFRWDTGIAC